MADQTKYEHPDGCHGWEILPDGSETVWHRQDCPHWRQLVDAPPNLQVSVSPPRDVEAPAR